jgi:hypothetical protein
MFGLHKLLTVHYPELLDRIIEARVEQEVVNRLKTARNTPKFKWKILSLKSRTNMTNREFKQWHKELTPEVLGISCSNKPIFTSLEQISDLIEKEVKYPAFQQLGASVERYWALSDMVCEWTHLHLTTPKKDELIWFKQRTNEFIWAITLDGSPETKELGKVVVSCASWNLGEKIHCRNNWIVIFGFNGTEQGVVIEEYCKKLQDWIKEIEATPLQVENISTMHKFIPIADQKMLAYLGGQFGQSFNRFSIWGAVNQKNKINPIGKLGTTWMVFTHTQRVTDGQLVEQERSKIEDQCKHLTEKTRSKKVCDFVNTHLQSAQKHVPLLDISRSLPDGTHNDCNAAQQWLGHLVTFSLFLNSSEHQHGTLPVLITTLTSIHLKHVAKKLQKKYVDNLSKNKKKMLHDVKWCLIGRDAIVLMQQFRLVAKSTLPFNPKATHLVWLQIFFVLGRLLRDISYHYSSRTTSKAMVGTLEVLCYQYYRLHYLYLPQSGITPTVFTIGKVVPRAARKTWKEYGVGLGYNLMQAPESVNAHTNTMLEETNWSTNMNPNSKDK